MPKTLISTQEGYPVGCVVAFLGGYFTSSNNTGFTNVLGNTISDINNYVSKYGFRVCDGGIPNDTESPVFNNSSKRLPDLTDDRFLKGSTSCGVAGGSNTLLNHSHSGTVEGHVHEVVNLSRAQHGHYVHIYNIAGNSGYGNPSVFNPDVNGWNHIGYRVANIWGQPVGDASTEIDQHQDSPDNTYDKFFRGRAETYQGPSNDNTVTSTSGQASAYYGIAGNNGDTGFTASSTDTSSVSNIPKYLNIVYITRIK